MSLSVMYADDILNRYACKISLDKDRLVDCIIDTACSTTLVPLKFAKPIGKRLAHTADITVAGGTYKATLYLFENVKFGNFTISKMVAFAADYKGNIRSSVLLGLNVLNNLEITFSRHAKALPFAYKPWALVKNKAHPCAMFFKTRGSAPVYPNELIVELDD